MYQAPRLSAPEAISKKYIRGLKVTAKSYLTKLQSGIFIFLLEHLKIEKYRENENFTIWVSWIF